MKNKKLFLLPALSIFLLSACDISIDSRYLYIATKPYKTTFNVSESFTSEGLSLLGMPSGVDVTTYETSIEEGYIFTLEDIGNNKTVAVSKRGYKDASYFINVVNEPRLIIATPGKTEFNYGDHFTFGELKITNEAGEDLTSQIKSNYSESIVLNKSGTFTVTISVTGYFDTSYQINVKKEQQLKVNHNPNKVNYVQGEKLNTTGLVIFDENDEAVNDYSLSIENGWMIKGYGSIEVIVSKAGYKDTSFTINVTRSSATKQTTKEVNIYYMNDTHGAFIRQSVNSYYGEAGMAQIGKYIKDQVAKDTRNGKASVVLSGGDMFQGGIESNLTYGAIMVDTMNIIGFDAMVLGNHEFDWGEEHLRTNMESLNFPVLSSNTFYASNGERPDYIKPYTIIDKDDLRIGIIGGARENMGSSISGSISNAFTFPNPIDYVKDYASTLRVNYNCDLVIAAFHDEGYEVSKEDSPTKFISLTEIDEKSGQQYVDAMFFAHDHYQKKGELNGVPYLESGCNAEYVGHMNITLISENGVNYQKTTQNCYNLNAFNNIRDEDYDVEINALPDKYRSVIGNPDEVLYTFTRSYSQEEFTYRIVCPSMLWYVNNHLEEFDNRRVYMASHNTGGVRSRVKAGNFTRRDLFKVFPFDNELCLQTCTEYNVNQQINSSYYATYDEGIEYDENGLTYVISISYIAEYAQANRYYQQSYVKYEKTAKDALVSYLKSGLDVEM